MEIEFNPENLEAIFDNRYIDLEVYNLIHFVEYSGHQTETPLKDEHGNILTLDYSNNYINKRRFGSKHKWVMDTINFLIFDRTRNYLYKHNGVFGYYNFTTNTFHKFQEDISTDVYKFYYTNKSL